MTTITVTEADQGQPVASKGILIQATMKTAPNANGYGSYITVVDIKEDGTETALYNMDPSTSYVGVNSVLVANGSYNFESLVFKSIPAGCTFELECQDPPALTSLNPDTAVSGDPDFTLSCIGTNFTPSTVIVFGQYDEPTTFVSDTEVTTIVKPSLFAPATVPVCVRIGNMVSDPVDFTFTEPAGAEAASAPAGETPAEETPA